jgi:hypothetical protein
MLKKLLGKYQIKPNIYVICTVDVIDANETQLVAALGTRRSGDTVVPVGTRLFFNADSLNKITAKHSNTFEVISVTVKAQAKDQGNPVLVCTPIQKETRGDLRQTPRQAAVFPIRLQGHETKMLVNAGSLMGLSIIYPSTRPVLNLRIDQEINAIITHKEREFIYKGLIKHIHYDWKTHQHKVGLALTEMDEDSRVILNLMLDPAYKIDISHKESIDTSEGKISQL